MTGDAIVDPIAAIVELLKSDAELVRATGGRIFGGELPAEEAQHMPRPAIVIKPSGGPSLTAGSFVKADTQRLDQFGFGATPNEAAMINARGGLVLRRARRCVHAGVLIHWIQSAGGFSNGREPGTDWPRAFQSFQLLHALVPATSNP